MNTKTFNDFLAGQDCISNTCQNFPVSGRIQQMDINHSAFSGSGYAPILTKDFNNDFVILRIKQILKLSKGYLTQLKLPRAIKINKK